MKKSLILILVIFLISIFSPTKAQNSGDRYVACTTAGCAIIGDEFCGFASTLNPDGTVTSYWCVIWVVEGDPYPEEV